MYAFREAIENSFCCGASIDLLLVGMDTDTDAIRVHVPNAQGQIDLDNSIDALELYDATARSSASEASRAIGSAVRECCEDVTPGMAQLIERLIENNFSQIAYVRSNHGSHYADIGHAERFIGAGVGFEEIQLRNLMYFAYLQTVEEGAKDMDVGVKIFSGLNAAHGLPIPVVITVYADRSFTFVMKTPPASILLKKAVGIKSGSGRPNTEKVGTVTRAQLEDIAKAKEPDLTAADLDAAVRTIAGSARSMGLNVEGVE